MKIGFDAKRFYLNKTGLGNYSRWLVKSLSLFYPDNQYLLYTPKVKPGIPIPVENFGSVKTRLPRSKAFTSWWRSRGIAADLLRDKVDIYHGLSHELPTGIGKTGIKTVVTVHDLIFLRFPQYFNAINRFIYGTKLKHACRVANKVIAISERTKQDITELLKIPANKIKVVYQSCDAIFKTSCTNEEKQAVAQKYHLPAQFILSVGTIEERKNLLLLIKALPKVQHIHLVIIGKQTAYAQQVKNEIEALRLKERVMFIDRVEFTHLPAIYQLAKATVYVSRYEGFGIPVLESLCSGTPVIAATGSCLEEAGGPHSLYANPDDADDLAVKINLVLQDESLRQNIIEEGLKYSRNFDDDKLTAQMMTVYTALQNSSR